MSEGELDRIRRAYEARDAVGGSLYRWENPGYVVYMHALERAVLQALRDASVRVADARVLDIGCGSGYFLHRFLEYGARECHGVDLMEERIAAGRQRYPTLELRVGSATELPYPDGTFDLVTQFTCLSSILDDDVRLTVAGEMRRAARGGWILSVDMGPQRARESNPTGVTPTVPLDERELNRLFGAPELLRPTLSFRAAQRVGRHPVLAATLAAAPFRSSHLLGVWNVAQSER
jgi:SAM-dependent methyltransferase